MSYSSKPYRYHKNTADAGAGFVVVILLAAIIWAHKVNIVKVEDMSRVAAIVIPVLLFGLVGVRVYRRQKAWRPVQLVSGLGIDKMSGIAFERYIAGLLKDQGFSHIRLTERYDFGVDIIAEKEGFRWGIQVKHYHSQVKAAAVRQVVTGLNKYDCDRAMVVTNSSFSYVAKELADSNGCVLIDGTELQKWISG